MLPRPPMQMASPPVLCRGGAILKQINEGVTFLTPRLHYKDPVISRKDPLVRCLDLMSLVLCAEVVGRSRWSVAGLSW